MIRWGRPTKGRKGGGAVRNAKSTKIFVLPKDQNPYQKLLYRAMAKQEPQLRLMYWTNLPYVGVLSYYAVAVVARARGYRIAHLHWPSATLPPRCPFRLELSSYLNRLAIRWLRLLGFAIVWTVHNVVPHEPLTSDDESLARFLAGTATGLIVHSTSTLDELEGIGAHSGRAQLIRHGNYIDAYPKGDASRGRSLAGLSGSARACLFLGVVKPYKGVEELVSLWKSLPEGRLVVAGVCPSKEHADRLRALAAGSGVRLMFRFVAPGEVADLYAAADFACVPARALTTSGSALLACSFGKPVVAPRVGSVKDIPGAAGFFYEASDPAGLQRAIGEALSASKSDLEERGVAALEYAKSLDWMSISAETLRFFRDLR